MALVKLKRRYHDVPVMPVKLKRRYGKQMRVIDLERAWPMYWQSHNVTDSELRRIATRAETVDEAQAIWEDQSWWRDRNRKDD